MSVEVNIQKQLDGFTLHVQLSAGDLPIALLGASGSGKSMTLRCIAGVERPDSGRIVVDGTVLFDSERGIDLPPQQRRVGLLFQSYALFPNMTVRQNVLCGAKRTGSTAAVDDLLAQFDLTPLAHRLPDELSGVQQQRVALARILASQPRILMLDEPFSALDDALRWRISQHIASVIEAFPGTTILVSHNREEVYRLSEQVAVIHQGWAGMPRDKRELFAHPRSRVEAELTGFENVADAVRLDAHTLSVPAWGVTLHSHTELPASVHAAACRARAIRPAEQEGENTFPAVVRRTFDGPETCQLLLQIGSGSETLRWERPASDRLPVGTRLRITLPTDALIPLTE